MDDVHIVGAKIFDGEEFHEGVDVVFNTAAITAVGPHIPIKSNNHVIDGSNCTVMPGLMDAHIHIPGMIEFADKHLRLATQFGVTFLVDFGSDPEVIWEVLERSRKTPDYPNVISAGTLATAPGGHPLELGGTLPTLSDKAQVAAFVRDRIREGSDFFKIVLEDGATYGLNSPYLDRNIYSSLVREAHHQGLMVATHAPAIEFAIWAVEEHTDILAHAIVDAPPNHQLIAEMVAAQIVMIPTLSVFESALANPLTTDQRIVSALAPDSLARLSEIVAPEHRPAYQIRRGKEWTAAYENAGGMILAGTDAPNPGTLTGVSLHRELQLLVESGLSIKTALASATSRVADTFNLTNRGRLVAGSVADVLMVYGDVEHDINRTLNITQVWRSGLPI